MATREVVFNARDTGVSSKVQEIRDSAKELGQEMLEDSRRVSNSAAETIKHYEAQVRLLEKRNRLESQASQISLQERRDDAKADATTDQERAEIDKQFSERTSEIRQGSKEDQMQIDLLREIVSTIREESIRTVRQSEESSSRSRNSASLDPESIEGRLAEQLRQESSSPRGGGVDSSRGGAGFGVQAIDTTAGVLGASSAGEVAGLGLSRFGRAGAAGLVAYGAMKVGGAIVGSAQDREQQLMNIGSLTGQGSEDLLGFGRDRAASLGFNREEIASMGVAGIRARGSSQNVEDETIRGASIQRATGIDQSTLNTIERVARLTPGDATSIIQETFKTFSNTGVFGSDNRDMARMDELLNAMSSITTERQMRVGDDVGSGRTNVLARGMANLGGGFSDPNVLGQAIQRIDQSIAAPSTREQGGLQMALLAQSNPGANINELLAMQEQGIESGLLEKLMPLFQQGTESDAALNFASMFGVSQTQANKLVKGIRSGDLSMEEISREIGTGEKMDIEGEAQARVGEIAKTMAGLNDIVEDMKDELTGATTDLVNALKGDRDALGDLFGRTLGWGSPLGAYVNALRAGNAATKKDQ